jgi:protein phosphatase 2C family protein 2/3
MNLSILQKSFNIDINSINSNHVILGPSRVFPGRLSVSRSFGDIEAKLIKNGGNPNVVIATPEITCFKLTSEMDYIVLGCKFKTFLT